MYVPSLTWCNSVAISEQNQKTVGTNRMKLTPPHLAEKQMLLYENMRPLAILCDLVGMGKMLPFQRWCSELPGSSRIESPSREGSCDFKTTWRIIPWLVGRNHGDRRPCGDLHYLQIGGPSSKYPPMSRFPQEIASLVFGTMKPIIVP